MAGNQLVGDAIRDVSKVKLAGLGSEMRMKHDLKE